MILVDYIVLLYLPWVERIVFGMESPLRSSEKEDYCKKVNKIQYPGCIDTLPLVLWLTRTVIDRRYPYRVILIVKYSLPIWHSLWYSPFPRRTVPRQSSWKYWNTLGHVRKGLTLVTGDRSSRSKLTLLRISFMTPGKIVFFTFSFSVHSENTEMRPDSTQSGFLPLLFTHGPQNLDDSKDNEDEPPFLLWQSRLLT